MSWSFLSTIYSPEKEFPVGLEPLIEKSIFSIDSEEIICMYLIRSSISLLVAHSLFLDLSHFETIRLKFITLNESSPP